MTLAEYRRLTNGQRSDLIFQQLQTLRTELTTIHGEIAYFRELETTRKKLRKRRAKAAKLEVG